MGLECIMNIKRFISCAHRTSLFVHSGNVRCAGWYDLGEWQDGGDFNRIFNCFRGDLLPAVLSKIDFVIWIGDGRLINGE